MTTRSLVSLNRRVEIIYRHQCGEPARGIARVLGISDTYVLKVIKQKDERIWESARKRIERVQA